jgi:hypothetical protein
MELTALVAFVIGADRALFQFFPARHLVFEAAIAGTNAIAGAYVAMRFLRCDTVEGMMKTARWVTACLAIVNSLAVATIIAEGFRQSTEGEYFTWSRDWPQFAIVVSLVTLVSIGGGMFLSMFLALTCGWCGRKAPQ